MHLAGDEKWQNFVRLGSALYAVMNAYQFVEKIIEPITSLDEAVQWCETVCGVVDSSQTTIADVVRQGYVVEVKETFRNFRDSGLLQVFLASNFLRRPIRQFCLLPGADHYRTRVQPCENLSDDETFGETLDILWLPLTVEDGQNNHYNHIVPLLPWKCGAAPYKLCTLNSQSNHVFSNSRSELAQCDLC